MTLPPDVGTVAKVMATATKDIPWNWGSEDLITGLDVVFVKMTYGKKCSLNGEGYPLP
jgi:hypothetical protein